MRRAPSLSSESDKDQDHPVSDDGGGGAGAFYDAEDDDQGPEPAPFHEPGLEDDMMHARETVTEQAPTTYRPSVREEDDAKVDELVRGVVRLKVKSQVSDAALDAMFNLFYEKQDTLVLIKEKSLLPTNYTNGVRPYATGRSSPAHYFGRKRIPQGARTIGSWKISRQSLPSSSICPPPAEPSFYGRKHTSASQTSRRCTRTPMATPRKSSNNSSTATSLQMVWQSQRAGHGPSLWSASESVHASTSTESSTTSSASTRAKPRRWNY